MVASTGRAGTERWEAVGPYAEASRGKAIERPVTALAISEEAVLAGTEAGLFRAPMPIADADWSSPGGLLDSGNHVVDLSAWEENPSLVWRTRRVHQYGAAERSSDAGETWQQKGMWPDNIFATHIHPEVPDCVMHSFGYVNSNDTEVFGVRTTNDGGDSWTEHDHGRSYRDLVGDPTDPNGVWMASSANGLYYSENFGKTWKAKSSHEANTILFTQSGPTAPAGSRMLIGGDAIRYSDDGGTTFETARIDIDKPLSVVAFAQHANVLFAATATASIRQPGDAVVITAGQGVLRSADHGKTWHDASGDLPDLDVRALAVDPAAPSLYAGLQGGSVYRLAL
jgi:hypothetical protein